MKVGIRFYIIFIFILTSCLDRGSKEYNSSNNAKSDRLAQDVRIKMLESERNIYKTINEINATYFEDWDNTSGVKGLQRLNLIEGYANGYITLSTFEVTNDPKTNMRSNEKWKCDVPPEYKMIIGTKDEERWHHDGIHSMIYSYVWKKRHRVLFEKVLGITHRTYHIIFVTDSTVKVDNHPIAQRDTSKYYQTYNYQTNSWEYGFVEQGMLCTGFWIKGALGEIQAEKDYMDEKYKILTAEIKNFEALKDSLQLYN